MCARRCGPSRPRAGRPSSSSGRWTRWPARGMLTLGVELAAHPEVEALVDRDLEVVGRRGGPGDEGLGRGRGDGGDGGPRSADAAARSDSEVARRVAGGGPGLRADEDGAVGAVQARPRQREHGGHRGLRRRALGRLTFLNRTVAWRRGGSRAGRPSRSRRAVPRTGGPRRGPAGPWRDGWTGRSGAGLAAARCLTHKPQWARGRLVLLAACERPRRGQTGRGRASSAAAAPRRAAEGGPHRAAVAVVGHTPLVGQAAHDPQPRPEGAHTVRGPVGARCLRRRRSPRPRRLPP